MKRKAIKLLRIIILTILLSTISSVSNAGLEIKPGSTPYTDITVSQSFQVCYDMRKGDSMLGNSTVDPHLTTNADWGAVAYLGLSDYGSVRSKDGISVTIGDASYYSTTNNITGVMNMGKNYTQTASLITEYTSNENIATLESKLNTKYVETLEATNKDTTNKGRAFSEVNWYSSKSSYVTENYPVGIRSGVLGYINQWDRNSWGSWNAYYGAYR